MTEKTIEEIKKEIDEQVESIVGKINNFDSKETLSATTGEVLNSIIAKVKLSKLEKAGTIAYLQAKRVKE